MSLTNSIRLVGRLTRDPEIHTFDRNGETQKLASFSVAVDRYSKNDHPEADFFDCTAYRQRAEFIEKYFHKGDRIILEGEGHFESWQDQDGNNRKAFRVTVSDCTFGSTGSGNGNQSAAPKKTEAKKPKPAPVEEDDDDRPW